MKKEKKSEPLIRHEMSPKMVEVEIICDEVCRLFSVQIRMSHSLACAILLLLAGYRGRDLASAAKALYGQSSSVQNADSRRTPSEQSLLTLHDGAWIEVSCFERPIVVPVSTSAYPSWASRIVETGAPRLDAITRQLSPSRSRRWIGSSRKSTRCSLGGRRTHAPNYNVVNVPRPIFLEEVPRSGARPRRAPGYLLNNEVGTAGAGNNLADSRAYRRTARTSWRLDGPPLLALRFPLAFQSLGRAFLRGGQGRDPRALRSLLGAHVLRGSLTALRANLRHCLPDEIAG